LGAIESCSPVSTIMEMVIQRATTCVQGHVHRDLGGLTCSGDVFCGLERRDVDSLTVSSLWLPSIVSAIFGKRGNSKVKRLDLGEYGH